MEEEVLEKDYALVVGTGTSKIGQSIANSLADTFEVIKTSKDSLDMTKLNILDVQSIQDFVQNYVERYGKNPLKVVFLNSGMMNVGSTITRSNFYRRSNNGDPEINIHLYNIVLLERLQMAGIINEETKVIYNATIQIIDEKKGYEDYAYMKRLVSNLLINDDRWDATVLCSSLVEGTTMETIFKNKLNKGSKNGFEKFIKKNMPYGQPSLVDVDNAVEQILLHKEETKGKLVFLDGGAIQKNKKESITDDFLFYDNKINSLISYDKAIIPYTIS
ncbi:MAG: hypothetical protein NTX91_03045 [candidate division SR1 bacterium]|nr:hypothetical protein [candidate division SR1 bacterium]